MWPQTSNAHDSQQAVARSGRGFDRHQYPLREYPATQRAHACPSGSVTTASAQRRVSFPVAPACASARSGYTTTPSHIRTSSQRSILYQLRRSSARYSRQQDWVLPAKTGAALLCCAVLAADFQNPTEFHTHDERDRNGASNALWIMLIQRAERGVDSHRESVTRQEGASPGIAPPDQNRHHLMGRTGLENATHIVPRPEAGTHLSSCQRIAALAHMTNRPHALTMPPLARKGVCMLANAHPFPCHCHRLLSVSALPSLLGIPLMSERQAATLTFHTWSCYQTRSPRRTLCHGLLTTRI